MAVIESNFVSHSPRFLKKALLVGKFPVFACLYLWQEEGVDEVVCGAILLEGRLTYSIVYKKFESVTRRELGVRL